VLSFSTGGNGLRLKRLIGLVLILGGLGALGFGGWQYFIADLAPAAEKQTLAEHYKADEASEFVDPSDATQLGDIFGRIYIPRLGDGYVRLVAEGVKWHPVLNEIGIGHYSRSQLPGEVGNFAVAAHRGGFGGSFRNIHRLTTGDYVDVETNDGWYRYEYRQTKIVKPEDTDVINPVPKELNGATAGGRYMTLTSCDPVFVNTDRIIVWLELQKSAETRAGLSN
jgi:sortase A